MILFGTEGGASFTGVAFGVAISLNSSGFYICKSVVNDLRHGNYICKSEENIPDIRTSYWDSSGVYICKSLVNYLRHGNYICKSEVSYLTYEHRIEIPVEFTYVNH